MTGDAERRVGGAADIGLAGRWLVGEMIGWCARLLFYSGIAFLVETRYPKRSTDPHVRCSKAKEIP
jgi:hypothetical protein